ncbi:MAG: G5 domain-containing protein, partial [Anaerolineales bacterium]
ALSSPPSTPPPSSAIQLTITADGQTRAFTLPPGLTVREALAQAGIGLGELDRHTPPAYSLISEGLAIKVTRVTETFEVEQAMLPFRSEVVKSDTLPDGQRQLLQAGANGREEITYRIVFEDGVQVSRSVVKRVVLEAPAPEIIRVGSQESFTIVPITGTLTYLNGGNAWIIRRNSGQRLPVTTSSDLNGRVFDLSPDGQWLLFTRAITEADSSNFNTLWAVQITATITATQPIDLQVSNVLYAEWSPTQPRTIAYSAAEKTVRAPGWQANNDLWLLTWGQNRTRQNVFTATQVLDSSSGGLYGWWGTGFAFAPDGATIAYARTDSIGLVDLATFSQAELTQFTAYNTHSDWAWYPALRWAPGGLLYTITHGDPLGLELPEDSPVFNLTALSALNGLRLDLIPRAGMFANPRPSPVQESESGELAFRIAFLQAVEPDNSPFSRYRLGVMDRDGSNVRPIFPPADQPGLSANAGYAWSPDGRLLAVTYEGNLWLVDPD